MLFIVFFHFLDRGYLSFINTLVCCLSWFLSQYLLMFSVPLCLREQ